MKKRTFLEALKKSNQIILPILAIMIFSSLKNNQETKTSIFDEKFTISSLEGKTIDFSEFKGKKILLVNTASKCGFTSQYKEMQELHEKYKDKLVVIGFPCNQFGEQEPGTEAEIGEFCERNYGVQFLITEKIDVKGSNQHPIFAWLTDKEKNGVKSSTVKWNFQKYLLDENGQYIDYFYSITSPMSSKITDYLK